MKCSNLDRRGFTLLELLIAVGIFSLLGAGLATTLRAGIQVKRRHEKLMEQTVLVLPVLAEIQHNLCNGVVKEEFPLAGRHKSLKLPVHVVERNEDDRGRTTVLLLEYSQGEQGGEITKKTSDLAGELLEDAVLGPAGLDLEFFYLNPEIGEDGLQWETEWGGEGPPPAVKIVLKLPAPAAEAEPLAWQRVVRLPVAPRPGRS